MNQDWFVRHPGDTCNQTYFRNSLYAADFFTGWFKQQLEVSVQILIEVTSRMHEIIAVGPDGQTPFQTKRYNSRDIGPGIYHQCKDITSRRPWVIAYIRELARLGLISDHINPSPSDALTCVPGIPGNYCPRNMGATHFYPPADSHVIYFTRATELLNAIKEDPSLMAIGEYYYTLINARPFAQINNSLFMNQVNCLLLITFGPEAGMSHGDLDHLAHRLPISEFQKVFYKQFVQMLPRSRHS